MEIGSTVIDGELGGGLPTGARLFSTERGVLLSLGPAGVARRILWAWVLTIPAAAFVGGAIDFVIALVGGQ